MKEEGLNTTHEKHRDLVPILDFSKLGNQNVSIIHEKSQQDDEDEENEEDSKMNSEDIINALNEDSLPESEEQEEEDAKHNDELDISHEQENEDSSIALPR